MICPVLMSGGSGTRLWPLSRSNYPKQFFPLCGNHTMLQETLLRLNGVSHQEPLLICNEEQRFIAAEQIRQLGIPAQILLEPVGRNTAPAIALAALIATANWEDPLLLVLASDHVIADVTAFQQAVEVAAELAQQDKLVSFGIVPTHAETGYGYIRRGSQFNNLTGFAVDAFVEKPAKETAEEYLTSGKYYWNSGMFMFKASRYLEELNKFRPDIYAACQQAVSELTHDLDFIRINAEAFSACPAESIDYAVMEKTSDAVVVPLDAGWADVGSFASLWQLGEKDESQNVLRGDIYKHDSSNNYIHSEDKLVATVGVDNLVIVNTKDALLVAHKDKSQDIKHIVEQLKNDNRPELNSHREVHRPWGKYDLIDKGTNFLVKRVTVNPGGKMSLQMHHHRAEHWIVVSGTAKVTIDGKDQYLSANQSVYIPITTVHALENPGTIPLELIEVQSGSYLGEDDIVRFADRYGRA